MNGHVQSSVLRPRVPGAGVRSIEKGDKGCDATTGVGEERSKDGKKRMKRKEMGVECSHKRGQGCGWIERME